MHLRGNEVIQHIYRRHYFPFIFLVIKAALASFPLYFVLFAMQNGMPKDIFNIAFIAISIFFVFVVVLVSFLYWADKLVVTNFRVILIDWKLLNISDENEAELHDIQDIHIRNRGILSFIPFLNYGSVTISTASSDVTVYFDKAPDPSSIKRFIFSLK